MYSKQRVRGGEGRCSLQPATSSPSRSLARVAQLTRELLPPPCHLHTLCEAHPDRTRLQGLHKPPQTPRRLGPAPFCFVGPRPQGAARRGLPLVVLHGSSSQTWGDRRDAELALPRCGISSTGAACFLKKGFSLLAQKTKQGSEIAVFRPIQYCLISTRISFMQPRPRTLAVAGITHERVCAKCK